jgi:hypothetical protein
MLKISAVMTTVNEPAHPHQRFVNAGCDCWVSFFNPIGTTIFTLTVGEGGFVL